MHFFSVINEGYWASSDPAMVSTVLQMSKPQYVFSACALTSYINMLSILEYSTVVPSATWLSHAASPQRWAKSPLLFSRFSWTYTWMLGNCSTTELCPQCSLYFLFWDIAKTGLKFHSVVRQALTSWHQPSVPAVEGLQACVPRPCDIRLLDFYTWDQNNPFK